MAEPSTSIQSSPGRPAAGWWAGVKAGGAPGRRFLERATLYGLAGSALIHLLIVLIAALITVRFEFADAGGEGGEGVEFAVLDQSELSEDASPVMTTEREAVEVSLSESTVELELLAEDGRDRSVDDLSESIAPALDPGGGSLTSMDASTGSAGAGSGQGSSFFGLEAEGRRFAYIVDISGSMNQLVGAPGGMTRWEQTASELARSVRALEPGAEFHIQLYSTGARSLFGVASWSKATPMNKRLTGDALTVITPSGGTDPLPAFEAVFSLESLPDAVYYMSDGEVADPAAFVVAVRQLNRRRRVPVHCVLFGDAGGGDALSRVESMLQNIARQSGGRYTRVRGGRP
jgi:hypothetical protein